MHTHRLGILPSTESCHMFPQAGAEIRYIRFHRHSEHPRKYNTSLALRNHRLRATQQPKPSSDTTDNLPGNITPAKNKIENSNKILKPFALS